MVKIGFNLGQCGYRSDVLTTAMSAYHNFTKISLKNSTALENVQKMNTVKTSLWSTKLLELIQAWNENYINIEKEMNWEIFWRTVS